MSIVSALNKARILGEVELKAKLHGELTSGPIYSPCWVWRGKRSSAGYGALQYKGKWYSVHRLAFEVFNDRVLASDEHVRHLCANRLCLNPEHLAIGTHVQNMRDKEISR